MGTALDHAIHERLRAKISHLADQAEGRLRDLEGLLPPGVLVDAEECLARLRAAVRDETMAADDLVKCCAATGHYLYMLDAWLVITKTAEELS